MGTENPSVNKRVIIVNTNGMATTKEQRDELFNKKEIKPTESWANKNDKARRP